MIGCGLLSFFSDDLGLIVEASSRSLATANCDGYLDEEANECGGFAMVDKRMSALINEVGVLHK